MSRPSAESAAQHAFDLGLLDERQLQGIWAEFGSRDVSLDEFLQLLVRRELLTNYQVERLLKGERTGFFFGKYKVLYLVGSGTFARVYRAVHRESGKVVAIKVLRKRFSENPAQYSQFVREGELGRALRHPNIVPIYEVVSKKHTHFLVMEFVEGRNLREFVKIRKRIEPVEAVRLMADITSGLQYAFEHGLTHRDLRIANVLVSSRGKAKLVDFGLAAMDQSLGDEGLGDAAGPRTIDYAALERATGVRSNDTRSDVYFLGCIFYHMLTGVAPLAEVRDRVQRLSRARFVQVVPVQKFDSSVPHSVALVVNKAMALDPELRYPMPGAMLADLRIAARRLAADQQKADQQGPQDPGQDSKLLSTTLLDPSEQPSIMVVESNAPMQDIFRSGLKRVGYRVLLTSDPNWALKRFRENASAADCVIFSTQELGKPALTAFNRFGEHNSTEFTPVVLLLGEQQVDWEKNARTTANRVVLRMPVTMKELRSVLGKLIPSKVG